MEKRIPKNIVEQLQKLGLRPSDLVLYINSGCNLRCKHCYIGNTLLSKNYYFKTSDIINLVNKLNPLDRITVLGGEPFLHPGLKEILNAISNIEIADFRITTNLTVLPSLDFFNDLVLKKITFCVSLDGANAETHEFIRGKNTFQETIKNIKKLSKKNADIEITHTLMKSNINQFEKFIELCSDLGIKKINIHRMSLHGNAKKNSILQITPTEYVNFRKYLKLKSLKGSKKGINVRYPILFTTNKHFEKMLKKGRYKHHARGSYYGKKDRVVFYPDQKVYISSEFFGTESFVGYFDDSHFFINESKLNEFKFFQNENAMINHLFPNQSGDEKYPIVLSVSFKKTITI